VMIKGDDYRVHFNIDGHYAPFLTPLMIYDNDNPRNNYFRIEPFAYGNISSVDDIGCNTGYFLLENLLDHSTTAAHEFGHSLGLVHPRQLDIRGQGQPGIMYPRGSIVDPPYQWNPAAALGEQGSTLNPLTRKVTQQDIDSLRLHRLRFNANGLAVVGEFSSVWHDAHLDGSPPV
jgi:hypothetical protein